MYPSTQLLSVIRTSLLLSYWIIGIWFLIWDAHAHSVKTRVMDFVGFENVVNIRKQQPSFSVCAMYYSMVTGVFRYQHRSNTL